MTDASVPSTPPPSADREIALVDLLDRLLAGGVVLDGDLVISIADVDLVRISLKAVIASIRDDAPGHAGAHRDRVSGWDGTLGIETADGPADAMPEGTSGGTPAGTSDGTSDATAGDSAGYRAPDREADKASEGGTRRDGTRTPAGDGPRHRGAGPDEAGVDHR